MKLDGVLRHKLSGERMRILRHTEGEAVATCIVLDRVARCVFHNPPCPTLIFFGHPTAICSIENLEPISQVKKELSKPGTQLSLI
jgi:hypothetical protein